MGTESRLKVGIFFNARSDQGGLYQYALTLVHCLYDFVPEIDFSLYQATLDDIPIKVIKSNWSLKKFSRLSINFHRFFELIENYLAMNSVSMPFRLIPYYRKMIQDQPDVLIYVKPTSHVFEWNFSSIFPIHDLQHRLSPDFPEVSAEGEFNRREILYKRSIECASAILTDSITGKEDVKNLYNVEDGKIFPLPYLPPTFRQNIIDKEDFSRIKLKYQLPDQYFFYPAVFWKHKNHARIIEAIYQIQKEQETRINLVFSGSKTREYENLISLARKLNVADLIHFIGYIPEEDILGIYQHSLGLIMPTFFGPTNIPVLEAWVAGCPVITSDIRGIREQVGEAALLVNPRDIDSIAKALLMLYNNVDLRRSLIQKGSERVNSWTPELFAKRLSEIISQVAYK